MTSFLAVRSVTLRTMRAWIWNLPRPNWRREIFLSSPNSFAAAVSMPEQIDLRWVCAFC